MRGEGGITKTTLEVAPFQMLVLQGSIDLRIVPGTEQHIEVEAQSNLAALLSTSVENGVWTITTEECFRAKGPFVVHLTTPGLEAITVQGSGDITSLEALYGEELELRVQGSGDMRLELQVERLRTIVQGSGDVALSGSAENVDVRVQGSGDVRATELAATDVKVSVMGSGDVAVQCNGLLDASIMGSGDIAYRGTPTGVLQNIKGSGSIRALE